MNYTRGVHYCFRLAISVHDSGNSLSRSLQVYQENVTFPYGHLLVEDMYIE